MFSCAFFCFFCSSCPLVPGRVFFYCVVLIKRPQNGGRLLANLGSGSAIGVHFSLKLSLILTLDWCSRKNRVRNAARGAGSTSQEPIRRRRSIMDQEEDGGGSVGGWVGGRGHVTGSHRPIGPVVAMATGQRRRRIIGN